MAANLFPLNYEDEILTGAEATASQKKIGYRTGLDFDWNSGDFVRDGRNRLTEVAGVDSWQSWCMNCLQTQRYKHLAYSSDFGIDIDAAFSAQTREEAESILNREITEALMADPYQRTEYVEEIRYVWIAKDAVQITVRVVGIEDVTIDITVNINGR